MSKETCYSFNNQRSCETFTTPDSTESICEWFCHRSGSSSKKDSGSDCTCVDKKSEDNMVVFILGTIGALMLVLLIIFGIRYCIKKQHEERLALELEKQEQIQKKLLLDASNTTPEAEKAKWYQAQKEARRVASAKDKFLKKAEDYEQAATIRRSTYARYDRASSNGQSFSGDGDKLLESMTQDRYDKEIQEEEKAEQRGENTDNNSTKRRGRSSSVSFGNWDWNKDVEGKGEAPNVDVTNTLYNSNNHIPQPNPPFVGIRRGSGATAVSSSSNLASRDGSVAPKNRTFTPNVRANQLNTPRHASLLLKKDKTNTTETENDENVTTNTVQQKKEQPKNDSSSSLINNRNPSFKRNAISPPSRGLRSPDSFHNNSNNASGKMFELTLTGPTPRGSMIEAGPPMINNNNNNSRSSPDSTTSTGSPKLHHRQAVPADLSALNNKRILPPALDLSIWDDSDSKSSGNTSASSAGITPSARPEGASSSKSKRKRRKNNNNSTSNKIVIPNIDDVPTPQANGVGAPHPISIGTGTTHTSSSSGKNTSSSVSTPTKLLLGIHYKKKNDGTFSAKPATTTSSTDEAGIRWVTPSRGGRTPQQQPQQRPSTMSPNRLTLNSLLSASSGSKKNKNGDSSVSTSTRGSSTPPGLSPLSALHHRIERDTLRRRVERKEKEDRERRALLGDRPQSQNNNSNHNNTNLVPSAAAASSGQQQQQTSSSSNSGNNNNNNNNNEPNKSSAAEQARDLFQNKKWRSATFPEPASPSHLL